MAGRPALRSKTVVQYNTKISTHYCLATVGQGAKSGNPGLATFNLEDDDDSDDYDVTGDDSDHEDDLRNRDDLNAMLVRVRINEEVSFLATLLPSHITLVPG